MHRQHLVAILDHGAELQAVEHLAVPSDPAVAIKHAATVRQLHEQRQHHEQRAEQDDGGGSAQYVEAPRLRTPPIGGGFSESIGDGRTNRPIWRHISFRCSTLKGGWGI